MYSPKDYWKRLAGLYDGVDRTGFAPVLHPKAPAWFNDSIDKLQTRAVRKAIEIAKVQIGARFLDVGCGTGRWIRRYTELGFSPFGVDATFSMLLLARHHQTKAPLTTGLAYSLPFPDGVFDCVSDITVIQHIPYELQRKALEEMTRVLRPGGRIILLELVRGKGSHIFPRSQKEWIRETQACGAILVKSFGVEYLFFDRLFVRLGQTVSRANSDFVHRTQNATLNPADLASLASRTYWGLRRVTVWLSTVSESLVAKVSPDSLATHAIFVLMKPSR